VAYREGAAAARTIFVPVVDEYWSSGPLDVVQIDVHTRLVTGFYLARDYPSTHRDGVCVAQSVFEKEPGCRSAESRFRGQLSASREPLTLTTPGNSIRGPFSRTLEDFGVEVIYRPVARPHFGGHVERLIGTTMGAVHLLRGTTFSSIKARGDYPAEARATMTLRELECWLALEILGKYHHRIHRRCTVPRSRSGPS
jgi:putative transposase